MPELPRIGRRKKQIVGVTAVVGLCKRRNTTALGRPFEPVGQGAGQRAAVGHVVQPRPLAYPRPYIAVARLGIPRGVPSPPYRSATRPTTPLWRRRQRRQRPFTSKGAAPLLCVRPVITPSLAKRPRNRHIGVTFGEMWRTFIPLMRFSGGVVKLPGLFRLSRKSIIHTVTTGRL